MEQSTQAFNGLKGKNIVITGASRGIGKSLAAGFAGQGCNLYLAARNESVLNSTIAALQAAYPEISIRGRHADLSDKKAAIGFGEWVLAQTSEIDILINNAGSFLPGSVHNEEDGLLEQMINTNLYSAYHLSRVLIPAMIKKTSGHIFNMCSIASLQAYKNGGSYSISKYALMGFSKNLREELKPFGIKVSSVYPGAVMTDSWQGFDNSTGRIMEVSDITAMIIACAQLSPQAVVEDVVLRPQAGDL